MTFHLQLQVFLTADLKTILDDYSQLRESGLVKKNYNFFCILYFFFFFSEIYLNFSFAHATWRLLSTKCGQNFCCCCLVKRKHSVEFAKKRLENLQKNARHGWKSLIEELVRIAKGVINQTASSRVMTFSTGFCPGSWCAYFVYITSCITQKGISSASRKKLRKRSIHETAKTRKFALGKN